MFKFGKVLLVSAIIFAGLTTVVSAQIGSERIIEFDSVIAIEEDASLIVTETITVAANGNQIKRGIYRDFPTKYTTILGINTSLPFDVISVTKNGKAEPYFVEFLQNGERLYIGHEDVFIPSGIYTYQIKYRTSEQLGFFENQDELFYNITGNGWSFPIEEATASIILPEGLSQKDITTKAYTGYQSEEGTDFTSSFSKVGDRLVVNFKTTRTLRSGEGLTAFVAWPKGFVESPSATKMVLDTAIDNIHLIIGFIGMTAAGIYFSTLWLLVGRDPEGGVIVPTYKPPQGVSPALARYVTRLGLDSKAITASIIDLGVKGYLNIKEDGSNFTIKSNPDSLYKAEPFEEELRLFNNYFTGNESLTFKNTNHVKVNKAKVEFEKLMKKNYGSKYIISNGSYFLLGAAISLVSMGLAILTNLIQYPSEDIIGGSIVSIFLLFAAFGIGASIIPQGKKVIYRPTIKSCFGFIGILFTLLLFSPFVFIGLFMYVNSFGIILGAMLIVVLIMNASFHHALKALTKEGKRLRDEVDGFKMFLNATERERLKIMHKELPNTLETYERYLPYAVALGLESQWTESFKDQIAAASQGTNQSYTPHWYLGTHFDSGTSISSFSSSLSSSVSSAATAPGSSSGGSGGSGGGGGGGGGGGW